MLQSGSNRRERERIVPWTEVCFPALSVIYNFNRRNREVNSDLNYSKNLPELGSFCGLVDHDVA
jgi:hypothetical protein